MSSIQAKDLTGHFTISEPQNPSMDQFYVAQIHQSTNAEALKIWNVRSGREIFFLSFSKKFLTASDCADSFSLFFSFEKKAKCPLLPDWTFRNFKVSEPTNSRVLFSSETSKDFGLTNCEMLRRVASGKEFEECSIQIYKVCKSRSGDFLMGYWTKEKIYKS